jgi:hypothetical protein
LKHNLCADIKGGDREVLGVSGNPHNLYKLVKIINLFILVRY